MFCFKCGKQLPDDAKFCSYCGYSIDNLNNAQNQVNINNQYKFDDVDTSSKQKEQKKWYEKPSAIFILFICLWPVGLFLFWKNQYIKKKTKITIISVILLIAILALAVKESETRTKNDIHTESQAVTKEKTNINEKNPTENNTKSPNDTLPQEAAREIPAEGEPPTEVDIDLLPENEYKAQCEPLWHDDIFFSKDNLEGKYVQLDLFVEESYFFEADAIYNSFATDFIKEFDLQRDFYKCGVQRKDTDSYMGGQIELYFSNSCGHSASEMTVGDHLIVYGKIIDYSTHSADGYNACSIIPKYIDNNGQ
ncbi:MAG: zinc-ribbon domain-containing protein [Lachnospiraceae bacterium]